MRRWNRWAHGGAIASTGSVLDESTYPREGVSEQRPIQPHLQYTAATARRAAGTQSGKPTVSTRTFGRAPGFTNGTSSSQAGSSTIAIIVNRPEPARVAGTSRRRRGAARDSYGAV